MAPQGKFQGLDLNEELYLGGYPDYGAIPKAGLSNGFVGEPPASPPAPAKPHLAVWQSLWEPGRAQQGGWVGLGRHPSTPHLLILLVCTPGCVRELRIQGEEIIFHDLNLTVHGISHCPTCRDRPCQVTPPHACHLAAPATFLSPGGPLRGLSEGQGVLSLTFRVCFAERGPVPGLREQQLCVHLPGWLHREPL